MRNVLLAIALAATGVAQIGAAGEPRIDFRLVYGNSQVKPGEKIVAAVIASIPMGYHAYGPRSKNETVQKMEIRKEGDSNFSLDVRYPEGRIVEGGEYEWYDGEVWFPMELTLKPDATAGDHRFTLSIKWQICTEKDCLPPDETKLEFAISIGNQTTRTEHFEKISSLLKTAGTTAVPVPAATPQEKEADTQQSGISEGTVPVPAPTPQKKEEPKEEESYGLAYLYLLGLASVVTPCVYPLIPITLGFFSSQSSGNKRQAIIMSVVYSIGLALTFTILGVIAGLAGKTMGDYISNPIAQIVMGVILFTIGLSMFGVWELRMPQFITNRFSSGRAGYVGAFIMGCALSVVASACLGPILAFLFVKIASSQDPVDGGIKLFAYAAGLATPFVLFGILAERFKQEGWAIFLKTFAVYMVIATAYILFKRLPAVTFLYAVLFGLAMLVVIYIIFKRQGFLTAIVKAFIGYLILAYGLKYASAALGASSIKVFEALFVALSVFFAFYVIVQLVKFSAEASQLKWFPTILSAVFVLIALLSAGIYLEKNLSRGNKSVLYSFISSYALGVTSDSGWLAEEGKAYGEWMEDEKAALEYARKNNKPVIIDFTAVWCPSCPVLKGKLDSPEVSKRLRNFVKLSMDVTDKNSENSKRMRSVYHVKNPPAVVFINAKGEVLYDKTIQGADVSEEQLVKTIESVK